MFDQLFTSSRTLERYCNAPLLEERVNYLAHCAAQGSTRSSLRLIAQHQLVLMEYLHLETRDSITVEEIQAATNLWVKRQPQPHTHNATDYRYARLRFISDAKQWFTFLGRLRPQETRRRPCLFIQLSSPICPAATPCTHSGITQNAPFPADKVTRTFNCTPQ